MSHGASLYVRPSIIVVSTASGRAKEDITRTQARTVTAEGKLSPNAQRKIKSSIRWLIACSDWKSVYEKKHKKKVKWKINMTTLTFHENMTDDKLARACLSRWIEMGKYRFDMSHYIWKAEPQARGAIHFHLTTNTYLPHAEVKYTWNRELRKHGLNNIEDNSTDVHAVVNVRSHENYLSDYFLNEDKHAGRRPIKGKLWGCSHGLSQAGKESIFLSEEDLRALQHDELSNSLYLKYIAEGKEIPEFMRHTDIYLTGQNYYKSLPDCPIKKMYYNEIAKLKAVKRQKEFWSE